MHNDVAHLGDGEPAQLKGLQSNFGGLSCNAAVMQRLFDCSISIGHHSHRLCINAAAVVLHNLQATAATAVKVSRVTLCLSKCCLTTSRPGRKSITEAMFRVTRECMFMSPVQVSQVSS